MRINAHWHLLAGLLVVSAQLTPVVAQVPQGGGVVVGGGVQSPRTLSATEKTEDELKIEIANRPSDFRPYIELARLLQKLDRIDDAERVLRDALAYSPKAVPVYFTLANLFLFPKPYPERMLAAVEEWRRIDPDNSMMFTALVNARMTAAAHMRDDRSGALSHLDQGLQVLDEASQKRPDDAMLLTLRATLLRLKANYTADPAERDGYLNEAGELSKRAGNTSGSTVTAIRARADNAGPGPGPRPPALPTPGGAVRVGGNIRQPTKTRDVKPVYPPDAQEARVQGVVILDATIDTTGRVTDVRILRSIPLLDQAAIDAVRQWEFTTTEINGGPVPVIMTVTVQFSLMQ